MSSAASQLAPYLSLRPLPTATLYLLLVRIRRVAIHYRIHAPIPELDILMEGTIALSRRERQWAEQSSLKVPKSVDVQQIAAPLTRIHDRLHQHSDHPGVATLHAKLLPAGLGPFLALASPALASELERILATLLSPVHQPYVETAGLAADVRQLARVHQDLRAPSDHRAGAYRPLDDARIALHHQLGLLFVRLFAVCWSEHPQHVQCRTRILDIWQTCSARAARGRTAAQPSPTAPSSTSQVGRRWAR